MKEEYTVTVEGDSNLRFDDEYGEGNYLRETWRLNGVIHRDFGPAVTLRHPATCQPVQEEYYKDGKRHRYGGPAIIVRDHATGNIMMAQFFERGKQVAPRDPFVLGGP